MTTVPHRARGGFVYIVLTGAVIAATLGLAGPTNATAPGNSSQAATAASPHTVTSVPFRIDIEVNATVEARDVVEVSIVPEQWPDLVVVEAAEHGARVKRDTVLVKFDMRRIDQAIRDLEAEAQLNEQALRQASEGLVILKKSVPLELAEAERASRQAAEDLKEFLEKGQPQKLAELDFQLREQEFHVAYVEQELKQLEKMYKADDLVEETEEIVLKRSRFQVEGANQRFKQFKAQREWQLTYGLPRQETGLKNTATQSQLGLQRARVTLPQTIVEQELNLAKLQYEDGKKKLRLAELKRDRERLTIPSPADGIVYYGRATRGAWPSADKAGEPLAAGAKVAPHQVLMSIVDPKTVRLRATVEAGQLRQWRPGLRGVFRPSIDPNHSLPATLGSISSVPIAPGKFDAEIEIDLAEGGQGLAAPLMPGIEGQSRFTVYSNPKAIVVPATAVRTDDDEQPYVMILDGDGNPQRRDVKTGQKSKDQVEILAGLKVGDRIQSEEKKEHK